MVLRHTVLPKDLSRRAQTAKSATQASTATIVGLSIAGVALATLTAWLTVIFLRRRKASRLAEQRAGDRLDERESREGALSMMDVMEGQATLARPHMQMRSDSMRTYIDDSKYDS